ncbi:hypothetical protein BBJ28_00015554 [Nothophytophthora sp. Chile5]|nr:hypothetical protein BBJ28_00015554 [Nothophytophthora sp. Chile5]
MPFMLPVECATPALEHIQYALLKEKHYPAKRNPRFLEDVQRDGMTANWRLRVCRWMFETAKEFELQMDSAAGALHFLDQFLSVHSVDRTSLQLLGMICMWSASKMHEGKPIQLEEMALMCDRKFSRAQMVEAEAQLVRLLGFRFNPPNAFTMARDFVNELPFDDDAGRRANCVASVFCVLERVLEDAESIACSASSLAKAAVQLVAKSEFHLTVAQVRKALETVEIQEKSYRAAFKIVRGVYFNTTMPTRTVTTNGTPAPEVEAEPVKSLAQSPTAVEEMTRYRELPPSVVDDDGACLICTETLDSPSPAMPSPAPARVMAAKSSTIGVTRTASSPSRSVVDSDRHSKRQRRLDM